MKVSFDKTPERPGVAIDFGPKGLFWLFWSDRDFPTRYRFSYDKDEEDGSWVFYGYVFRLWWSMCGGFTS